MDYSPIVGNIYLDFIKIYFLKKAKVTRQLLFMCLRNVIRSIRER